MEKRKRIICMGSILFGVFGFMVMIQDVLAIDYPTRPITLIVAYAPGGSTDLGSKIISQRLSEFLGQPIISEYKAGAAGSIGATFASRAKPDGYTLVIGSHTPMVILPLVKKLDYSLEDFIIIFGYSISPITIYVSTDSPWKNLAELVADAKRNPGKYSFGTAGVFHMGHFVMEFVMRQDKIKLTHIPFEGSEKANTALLGGHIHVASTPNLAGLPQAGKVRPLAVAEKERFPGLENVPTLTELGYPCQLNVQFSFCAPKKTPIEIITKISDAYKKVFNKYGKELEDYFMRIEQRVSSLDPQAANQKYQEDYKVIYELAKGMGVLVKK